ncbi:DNA methyltransferase [Geothrix fuzhouensis]|uniref:DNA methyltransferase n=1 Tax=Geothrix fuzhouensis TaxID=2966451 RepID=UPI0021485E19
MNQLFFGDNLHVLRESLADASVDLVYLDPPFNSKRDYNLLFKSPEGGESHAQITAFEDSWHWGEQAEREYGEILQSGHTRMADLISAFRSFLGENDVMAYLVMMANRLLELHRVLKPTGSLYLHCDPAASHYLKLVLDGVFGPENFLNEVIWKRTTAHSSANRYGPIHDTILYYGKAKPVLWNQQYTDHDEAYLETKYRYTDKDGRRYRLSDLTAAGVRHGSSGKPWHGIDVTAKGCHWKYTIENLEEHDANGRIYWPPKGTVPQYKRYLDEMQGTAVQDIWDDIPPINSQAQERLGYPTQKPIALLERILNASSNPGDVILDPFCGCGTAVHAAQKLGRSWIGIDITHLAISLIEKRLKDAFPGISFEVHGTPKDLEGARDLAERDKYQFQWWACSLVDAQPFQGKKKGADGGIDGVIYFADAVGGKAVTQRLVVSVKGGSVNVAQVRDLKGVLDREKAPIGLFVTLEEPTKPMRVEAASAGFYKGGNGKDYPRLQILTVAELLEGRKRAEFPDLSMGSYTFKKAKKENLGMAAETPNLFTNEN